MWPSRMWGAIAIVVFLTSAGCENGPGNPVQPGTLSPTVRVVFQGATELRADLPTSAATCVSDVGATHIHPSWRSFATVPMTAVPPSRYEIEFTDVPVSTRVTFRVNDQNSCGQNPTGAVTTNILVNDVRLSQNATTPGTGDEPGFAFTVRSDGTVTQ